MRQRVQREPAPEPRGVVAEPVRDQPVRHLVDGHRDEKRGQLQEDGAEEGRGIAEESRHPRRR